jgi:hypothetical protein
MATILTITKEDTPETIQQKIKVWNKAELKNKKGFHARKYTGKIKSFGDGLAYQRKIRNEWD